MTRFNRSSIGLMLFATVVVCLMLWAANAKRIPDSQSMSFNATATSNQTDEKSLPGSPCATALTKRAVCVAANTRALELMRSNRLKAVMVVQDVRTGALVSFAASHPTELDVTTAIRPLSLSKVLLAASWWDNAQPDSSFDSTKGTATSQNPAFRTRVTIHEMLVGGSDSAGRQAAIALRKSVGTKRVLDDFARYGFPSTSGSVSSTEFWSELDWKTRLTPAPAIVSLNANTKDDEWAETLSLGEINMTASALHLSRLLQAIGNDGLMLPPIVRDETNRSPAPTPSSSIRLMQETTAHKIQSAMRDTVQRGTARSIATSLAGTGWQIGGKTGSGPALLPKGDLVDGWFAGLIFDPSGRARFTVSTFVRSGGRGGEKAAQISAGLARYLIGDLR